MASAPTPKQHAPLETVPNDRRGAAGLLPAVALLSLVSMALVYGGLSQFRIRDNDNAAVAEEPLTCAMQPVFEEDPLEVMGRAAQYFNHSDPMVLEYARLAHKYLAPWAPIQGPKGPVHDKFGTIRPETLRHVSKLWLFMACCGHVKVLGGKLYYRYGGFYTVWYRLLRFMQSLKMIQDAIAKYGLHDLHLEFFLNTCDLPLSFFSAHWPGRGGFPVLSTGATPDTMDVLVPDPLDLTPDYTPDLRLQTPWERKVPRAVFRGATTNFDLRDGNWGAHPRLRLHRMADAHPQLLDTRVSRWSHAGPREQEVMRGEDNITLGGYMNFTALNAFKYQVVVDGGAGSSRTCGVLRSNQLVLRQRTPTIQFFEPLLQDSVHLLRVKRTFTDLPSKVRWAQQHDAEVRRMVERANERAEAACTWRGRTLFWGILLAKYQDAIWDPAAISRPSNICNGSAILEAPKLPAPQMACTNKDVQQQQQHPCVFYCIQKAMSEDTFVWLTGDSLKEVERVGPGQEGFG